MKNLIRCLVIIICILNVCVAQTGNVGIGTAAPGSKLTVNGSFAASYKTVSAGGAVGNNDFYIAYNGAADATLTLPAATAAAPAAGNMSGRIYHFKNVSNAALTIAASGAELIDAQPGAGVKDIILKPGFYAMLISKGTTSGATWELVQITGKTPPVTYEAMGTDRITIAGGTTADIPGTALSFTTTEPSSTLLITYSAIPTPSSSNRPVHGSIDLLVDGEKISSSFYSAFDAPDDPNDPSDGLKWAGNYATFQKVVVVNPGEHTVKLQAKSWHRGTIFNYNPTVLDNSGSTAFKGAVESDANTMKARLTIVVLK